MKRIILFLLCLSLVQCKKLFEGRWAVCFQNNSDQDMIFEIDLIEESGYVYPKRSFNNPSEYTIEFAKQIIPAYRNKYAYEFVNRRYSEVKINEGDSVSVYIYHPDTLDRYSWDEVVKGHKYWFKRAVIPKYPEIMLEFPFED